MLTFGCVRCESTSNTTTMSFLNTDVICMDCAEEEKKLSVYELAKSEEARQVRNGNLNYPGLYAGMSWEELKRREGEQ